MQVIGAKARITMSGKRSKLGIYAASWQNDTFAMTL
jgi:hypothetical protein